MVEDINASTEFGAQLANCLSQAEDQDGFETRLWDTAIAIQNVIKDAPDEANQLRLEAIDLIGDEVQIEHTIQRTAREEMGNRDEGGEVEDADIEPVDEEEAKDLVLEDDGDTPTYEDAGEMLADLNGRVGPIAGWGEQKQVIVRGKEQDTGFYVSIRSDPSHDDPWLFTLTRNQDFVASENRIPTPEDAVRMVRDVIEDEKAKDDKRAPPDDVNYQDSQTRRNGQYRMHLKQRESNGLWDWEVKTSSNRHVDADWGYESKLAAIREAREAIKKDRNSGKHRQTATRATPSTRTGGTRHRRGSGRRRRRGNHPEPDVVT